ncbi:MAG: glycosyltransferase family 39 protein [Elusimicrobiota bacterium]
MKTQTQMQYLARGARVCRYIYDIAQKIIYKVPVLMGIIIAGAIAVRLWGINWGLPLRYAHIDESVVIFYAFRFFTGDLNPHVFFDYPTLFLYLIFGAMSVYFFAGNLMGFFPSLEQFAGKYFHGDISDIYVLARLVSVAFAVATVYLVYRLGKLVYSEKTGVLAAVFMAFNCLHVLHSHYATVDVAALFMVLLSVFFMVKYFTGDNTKDFLIACFALGLAVATKYYPVIFSVILFVVIPLLKKTRLSKRMLSIYAAGMVLVIAGFFAGCPYALLDYKSFLSRFTTIFVNVVLPERLSIPGQLYLIGRHVFTGVGPVLSVAFLVSMLFYFKTSVDVLLFSFFLLYVVFISGWRSIGAHYLFPLYPFMFIITARGMEYVSRKTHRHVYTAVAAIFLMTALPCIIHTGYVLTREDTRRVAYGWVKENVPAGSRILRFPYTPEFSPSDNYVVKVDWEYKVPPAEYKNYDSIITSGEMKEEAAAGYRFELIKRFYGSQIGGFHNPEVFIYRAVP